MLDLGTVCYRNEQHKRKYEQHPQNFTETAILFFDQEGRLKKAVREKTGKKFDIFNLQRLAKELEVQLSEDWEVGPFMEF